MGVVSASTEELALRACNSNSLDAEFTARCLSKCAMREKGKFLKMTLYFVALVSGNIKLM